MNLKEGKEGNMGGYGERKGNEEMMGLHIISKIKEKIEVKKKDKWKLCSYCLHLQLLGND